MKCYLAKASAISCSGVVKPRKPNFSFNNAITLSFKNAGAVGPV